MRLGDCQSGTWQRTAGGAYCPTGTSRIAAIKMCVDNADSGSMDWMAALQTCAAKGLVLPDIGALTAVYNNRASVAGLSTAGHWSATAKLGGATGVWMMYLSGAQMGLQSEDPVTSTRQVRCVRPD